MNIAFDATALLADMSRNRGIGNYVSDWMDAILKADQKNQYFCINMYNMALNERWEDEYSNFQEIRYYTGERIEILRLHKYKDVLGRIVSEFLEEYDIDVFLITSPFDTVASTYDLKWFKTVRTIAIVYDIIPYIFKEVYFSTYSIQKKYMDQVMLLKQIDRCLAISESTRRDMINYLNFPSGKIDIIWGAANEKSYRKLCLKQEEEEKIKHRFGIKHHFFICTGGGDPRKNLDRLISAYFHTSAKIREKYQLVIVCQMPDEMKRKSLDMIQSYSESDDRVVFTGFISEEDLVCLYNLADALLFPSIYEGFGLPIVEAWLCGTAVLTSDNSSLKEIGETSAVLVNAESVEDITKGIEQIADKEQRYIYQKRGRERVRQYTWEKTVQKTLSVIEQLPPKNGKTGKKITQIAFFTPLPPVKSGISDYSYDILGEISKYFDIDVFIDNGYEVGCVFPPNVRVYRHYDFMDKAEEYDEIVYQVGGSLFHSYMFDYIKEYKGIVVLHDLNLHGTLDAISGIHIGRRFLQYINALGEEMSEAEMNAYICRRLSNFTGSFVNENPFNGFVVNYARSVIVHSNYAKEKLLHKDATRNVAVIPLYAREINKYSNKKSDVTNFAVFGRLRNTKRIMPILKAFNRLVRETTKVRLLLVGELQETLMQEYDAYVSKYELQEYVKLVGYVPLKDFEEYIGIADVCLNLRYPYMGETSATLARILGMGKCSIVNDVGSFSDLPDSVCIKIPPVDQMTEKEEVDRIYMAMKKSMDLEVRTEIGENAYRYAKDTLDLGIVGNLYRDVITGTWKKRLSNEELRSFLIQNR